MAWTIVSELNSSASATLDPPPLSPGLSPEGVMSALPRAPGRGLVGSKIARGAMALFSTQPLTWASSILTIALVPHFLGAESFGRYTVALTIANLAATAFGLGVADFLVRRVAQRPDQLRRDMSVTLTVTTVSTIVGAVVLALVVPWLGFQGIDSRLLVITLLGMVFGPGQWVLLSAFQGREEHKRWAWFNAANVVLAQVAGVLALWCGGDVYVYAGVVVVVSLATTLVAFRMSGLRPAPPTRNLSLMREFVAGGFPFVSGTLTNFIASNIDRVILGALVPVAEVGWYAATVRIIYIPIFIPTLIITPLFPAISKHAREPAALRRELADSLMVVLLLTAPLSAGIIVAAPLIPSLLHWPADFQNAVPLMQILSFSMPIIAIDMVLGTALKALGRERGWAVVALLAALFNPLLNVALIPVFEQNLGNGAIAAAMVVVLTELLILVGALILMPKGLIEPGIAWVFARTGLAAGLAGFGASAVLPLGIPGAIAVGGAIYAASVLGLRVVRLNQISIIAQLRPGLGSTARD